MSHTIAGVPVAFTDTRRDWQRVWQKFDPATVTLPKGWEREPGYRPLPVGIVWHRDSAITLRDGVKIYADIFRPKALEGTPVPAVISWGPFGKTDKGFANTVNLEVGIPRNGLSGLESFEGLDPAEWCQRGYAIVNIDGRGSYNSEGDLFVHGKQEGEDSADSVEWIAKQGWSNGSVGMAGNSWLAVVQWFTAAQKPPHLKAIAPWEGASDFRRHILSRGGIGNIPFLTFLLRNFSGSNQREDILTELTEHKYWNPYWEDKVAKYDQLDLPMYITGSYSTALHIEGSIKGFNYSNSKEKWLRIHPTQEWHDLYSSEGTDDLQRFFDRYLNGKNNGWEATPRVRLSLLRYNAPPIRHRPESEYPPARVQYEKLYLDTKNQTLVQQAPGAQLGSITFAAHDKQDDGSHFTLTFDKYTELIGFSKAVLYVSTDAGDDLDVYVVIRKLDKDGNALINNNIPLKDLAPGSTEAGVPNTNIHKYIGPNGALRASWRAVLPEEPGLTAEARKLTTPAETILSLDREEKLQPGQIVKLEIQIWPGGIAFNPGESLRFEVKGNEILLPEIAVLRTKENPNKGRATIYSSQEYPSHVLLPFDH
ncbi:Alpha/Beta hydrolase protein [Leptodontidium sp. 2 PMI_412]|nr:Alpha/Beta hydrolase protein [Leptodontidium sp. 2 PMI_412]